MVVNATEGVLATIAWIATLLIDTGQVVGALVIGNALWSRAAEQWIAVVSWKALAASAVIVIGSTDGVLTALGVSANFNAFSVDASLLRWAL